MTSANVLRAIGWMLACALMVLSLWAWTGAWRLSTYATRPEVAAWAIRAAAVAAASLAQLLVLSVVVRRSLTGRAVIGRDFIFPRYAFAAVCSIALISAIALGLAGR